MTAAANNTDLKYTEYQVEIKYIEGYAEREMRKLSEDEKKLLKGRIDEISKMKWRELVKLKREKGLTPERRNSDTRRKILNRALSEHPEEKIYPSHFRVSKLFRVFCYQYKKTLYIAHLDPKHKGHKRR